MTQQGKSGMGSHKHGTSGRGGPSPKAKLMRAMDANKLIESESDKRPRPKMFGSVKEVMEATRK